MCALGNDAEELKEAQDVVGNKFAGPAHPPDGEIIPSCLGFEDVTFKRIIPRHCIGTLRQVFLVLDVETDGFDSCSRLGQGAHFRDTITQLDLMSQGLVFWDGWIPTIRHTPLVDTKLSDR